ncbi:MAG: DUF3048 domain-containing protein [Acidimicrobiales bacterium]
MQNLETRSNERRVSDRRSGGSIVALAIASVLLLAGCGSTATSDSASDGLEANAGVDSATSAQATSTSMGGGGSSPAGVDERRGSGTGPAGADGEGDSGRRYEIDIDELAFAIETTTTPTTQAPETTVAPSTTAGSPAPTSGSGGAPVTTSAGGGGGDVSIYQGVLGSIGLDDVIAPAVVAPPVAIDGIMPLTGLAGTVPSRPAAMVKIDNGSKARPQTGLNSADIVIEEEVEGGITRFAAIFHSNATIVGPVRSGRTTDLGVLSSLGSPLLLYSGANQVTDDLLRAQSTVQNRSAASSSGYWRNTSRRAPSNLYSDTAPHWASATGGPPPPQFAYRADGVAVGGSDVSSFKVSYRASKAAWAWDGSAWLRSQGGWAHNTASGEQISAANVVVIEAEEVATGMVDSSGARVPEFVFVGTGKATVFTAGKRIDGIWTKPTLRSVATLTTADGVVIELTPGRTWIELIGAGSGLLS